MELNVHERNKTGTHSSQKVRDEGRIPAVCYGKNQAALPVFVDRKEFLTVWKEAGETTIISCKGTFGEKTALIHDVQHDPLSGQVIHADFYFVEKDSKIHADIPLEFEGVSPAVKDKGGVLVQVLHTIPVESLPASLPQSISVDLSSLVDINSHIKVGDIILPEGVVAKEDEGTIVVSIKEQKVEEEPVQEDTAPEDVELSQQKGKKEEEEQEE